VRRAAARYLTRENQTVATLVRPGSRPTTPVPPVAAPAADRPGGAP
jgi:hypothetical protein